MTIKFFLGFVSSLLVCSILLTVVVKNLAEGFAISGKKPFMYGSFSSIIASFTAYIASFISKDLFDVFWFFGGVFLLFGILHVLFIHKRYFYSNKNNSNKVLIAEILFSLSVMLFTIAIVSSLLYFVKGEKDFLFYPILFSSLLFLVPLLIFHSFKAAYNIPAPVFPTWQYPLRKPIDVNYDNPNERILVIGFEIAKRAMDSKKTYFRVGSPETWKLGDLFYHFINEHNDPQNKVIIEYSTNEFDMYDWIFYKKVKWYQAQKILNPEYTVRENGIIENNVIVCERVLNN